MQHTFPSVKIAGLIVLSAALAFFSLQCAGKNEEKQAGSENQAATANPHKYGKIKEVKLDSNLDESMITTGGKIFDVTCVSCHHLNERYVGPGLGGVTHRRPPEYVMNMILDTETMIENDDTVRCLLQTYLLKMPNMQVSEGDARSVLEYLRKQGKTFDANNAQKP